MLEVPEKLTLARHFFHHGTSPVIGLHAFSALCVFKPAYFTRQL